MLKKLEHINKKELSFIEVAHAILEEKGAIMEFNDLLVAIQDYLGLSEFELERKMSTFYTELNIDGSFISLGENRWGLRAWYPIDSIDEELVSALDETESPRRKRKKVNAFAVSDDDLDYSSDDPEDADDLDDELTLSDDIDRYDDVLDSQELDAYHNDLSELETDADDLPDIEDDLTIISDEEAFEEI